MPERPSIESISIEARKIAPDDRARFLKDACGNDPALRAKVEALLEADHGASGFRPTADIAPEIGALSEEAGQKIGRYKLLEQIGEGGFGTVWMADQREPIRRRVALKIIKLGMDTKQVIARFEAERQALAMMDHVNIARVLDAGSTETGRPFFVMELVKGVPILEYCDKEKLDTSARLRLFMQVCMGIQHAHQKGIIHRDIKPSNVLITLHDGVPVVKVIDFGIAKATNTELTEKTLFTRHRHMIGTPAYMSPEQAEMSGLDIDTRSDIYSLGVLLYELLTGTTPFDSKKLASAGFAEMMRIIREEEPHRPSTRVSTLGQTGSRTAEQRQSDVKRLGSLLRGDLDWIVMKCLEKDRTRRYDTANGLAMDIERHLLDQPVLASPPGAGYKLRKFVRRNRRAVMMGTVVVAALVLGLAGTSTATLLALKEKSRADEQATRARSVLDLTLEMLSKADEHDSRSAEYTVRQLLDDFGSGLGERFAENPLVEAEVRRAMGKAYRSIREFDQAKHHIDTAIQIHRRELGEHSEQTLDSLMERGLLLHDQEEYREAIPIIERVLEGRRGLLGPEHPKTLKTMYWLGDHHNHLEHFEKAEALLSEALAAHRRADDPDHDATVYFMRKLAQIYEGSGRFELAISLQTESFEHALRVLGPEGAQTLYQGEALAITLLTIEQVNRRDPERALLVAEQTCAAGDAIGHKRLWRWLETLALAQHSTGDTAAALKTQRRAIELLPVSASEKVRADFAEQLAEYEAALGP